MHEARLVFTFPSVIASAISGALSPETGADVPKTSSAVGQKGEELVVRVEAEDLSALRAALNSHLRWADAAERAARLGASQKK